MSGGVQTLRNVSAYNEHFDAQSVDKQAQGPISRKPQVMDTFVMISLTLMCVVDSCSTLNAICI